MTDIDWIAPAVDEVIVQMINEDKFTSKIMQLAFRGKASEEVKRKLIAWLIRKELLLLLVGERKSEALRPKSKWILPRCVDDFLGVCSNYMDQPWKFKKIEDRFPMGRTIMGTPIAIVLTKEFVERMRYDEIIRHPFNFCQFCLFSNIGI